MKTILLATVTAVAITITTSTSTAASGAKEEFCLRIADTAKDMMEARNEGVPKHKMMEVARGSTTTIDKLTQLFIDMTEQAYDAPKTTSPYNFADTYYSACMANN